MDIRLVAVLGLLAGSLAPATAWSADAAEDTVRDDPETESYRLGRLYHQRLVDTDPFLAGDDPQAGQALGRECARLNRRCLRFLRTHRETARRAVPDNPAYWSAYAEMLSHTPLARTPEDVGLDSPTNLLDYDPIFEAARLRAMRSLLDDGGLDAAEVRDHVESHRRLMAQSGYLIDKMVFVATHLIALGEANVLMAGLADPPTDSQRRILDRLLRPPEPGERSLRRVMAGEYRYAVALTDQYRAAGVWTEALPEEIRTVYDFVAQRSELPWADYWREGVDLRDDVPVYIDPEIGGSWEDYATNVRTADIYLIVLRALREMYEGRVTPGIPASPAPAYWHWRWEEETRSLCLEPGYVHASLDPPEICVEYLEDDH